MRIPYQKIAIIVLAALVLAMGIALFGNVLEPALTPRLQGHRTKPAHAVPSTVQPSPSSIPGSRPNSAVTISGVQSSPLDMERNILTRYATLADLRTTSASEFSGKRLHEILDDPRFADPLLVAGAIVMHEAQNHDNKSIWKCWNQHYIDRMMVGAPHYSPRNAQLMALNLWDFTTVEGCKDLALSLLIPHDHLKFTDQRLRADYHKVIGLCKRGNPRYPPNDARREFRSASQLFAELSDHKDACSAKLEEIKVIMDGNDAVRDRQELTTELAACDVLLLTVAKEDDVWGRYRFIEGRFHRDLHAATRDPDELVMSERCFREAITHKKEHKAKKDSSYYNLLTIHAESCLLLSMIRPSDPGADVQAAIDELLELIDGNCKDLTFQEYSYALKLLETAYIKAQKLPLYLDLLQRHQGRAADAPGLAAAVAMERERIRGLMEPRMKPAARRSDDEGQ
ncbi:MAG: hypothetical protein J0M02_02105 [Planctomycetes bacterium]|nr:hypothetical protein [Planctomycetota bacterium]